MILGDYHTHTVFSHGKDQIIDNVVAAKNAGLKEVAISDHGLGHIAFGVRRKEIAEMRRQIDEAQKQNSEVRVLFGIEANLPLPDSSLTPSSPSSLLKLMPSILGGNPLS